jgi:hypothetical protein
MLAFLQDSSNQRKLAVAIAASLALFSSKIPFLANVEPGQIQWLIGALAVWIGQSGLKAAAEAHAEGMKASAVISKATDAVAVFNQVSGPGAQPDITAAPK